MDWESNLHYLLDQSRTHISPLVLNGWKGVPSIEISDEKVVAFPTKPNVKLWLAEITGTSTTYNFERRMISSKNIWSKSYGSSKLSGAKIAERFWEIEPGFIYEIGGPVSKGSELRVFFYIDDAGIKVLEPKSLLRFFDMIEEKEPIIPQIENKRLSDLPEELRTFAKYL